VRMLRAGCRALPAAVRAWARGPVDAYHCARVILRGVERDRDMIVVTPSARVCWWLYRIHPALIKRHNRAWVKIMRDQRRER